MPIPNDNSDFAELNDWVIQIIGSRGYNMDIIINNPIRAWGIERLRQEGWRVSFEKKVLLGEMEVEGITDLGNKSITILEDLFAYAKDKTVCHEIVHAHYGSVLNDESLGIAGLRNNAIVEWYARHVRASPSILAEIWRQFEIPPKIYDRASLIATKQIIKPQLIFPSFERDYDFTLMD